MKPEEDESIRILIADEHDLVRLGFRTLVKENKSMELAGESGSFDETLQIAKKISPHVILLDTMLADGDIIERIPELLAACPLCKILLFTSVEDHDVHLLALRLGVLGIFPKKQGGEILLKAINCVNSGEVWINRFTTGLLLQNFSGTTANDQDNVPPSRKTNTVKDSLTPREFDVASLAAQGMSAKTIASKLFISEKTVRNQLTTIYSKLGVSSQIELALQAAELGILIAKK